MPKLQCLELAYCGVKTGQAYNYNEALEPAGKWSSIRVLRIMRDPEFMDPNLGDKCNSFACQILKAHLPNLVALRLQYSYRHVVELLEAMAPYQSNLKRLHVYSDFQDDWVGNLIIDRISRHFKHLE